MRWRNSAAIQADRANFQIQQDADFGISGTLDPRQAAAAEQIFESRFHGRRARRARICEIGVLQSMR